MYLYEKLILPLEGQDFYFKNVFKLSLFFPVGPIHAGKDNQQGE